MKPPLAVVAVVVAGCGGASYGHAPTYVPLDAERAVVDQARPYDAAAVQHRPDQWATRGVALFGIVESRSAGPGGQALLRLDVRVLEPANLCTRRGEDDSCRVTVSDKGLGVVWVLVPLREGDDVGANAVGQRSLLRVAGVIGQDVSPTDGAPIIHATWYRHWPSAEYLTPATAAGTR
jgi:hypothetical protein